MIRNTYLLCFIILLVFLSSCLFDSSSDPASHDNEPVQDVGGNPSPGSQDIYASSSLNNLCIDENVCGAPYDTLPDSFIFTEGQSPLETDQCNFDYDPNKTSTFVLNRVDGSINGLNLLLSKEDLFFLAWVSVRYKINPYFLLGVLSQESAGNCAAVSAYNGEGCFQITNTYGQAQLDESYPGRVADWFWSDQSGSYYPDDFFVDAETYFGETPSTDQFRLTLDPTAHSFFGTEISSIVNFNFGVIGSALYFYWQQYLIYNRYDNLQEEAADLFQTKNGKALWQAAAYNGGAYGAANALEDEGEDFLDEMTDETQNYAPAVVDYCVGYQSGTLSYGATYSQDDGEWLVDLLAMTYPDECDVDWDGVKEEIGQIFFEDGTEELTFVDDIKALIYVISTHDGLLGPEWPEF